MRGEEAAAALAVNAAICAAGLAGRRKTNPVVDGRPVPRPARAPTPSHGVVDLRDD